MSNHQVFLHNMKFIGDDFNGQIGSQPSRFGEVNSGYGIGHLNDRSVTLMDWAVCKWMKLMNT